MWKRPFAWVVCCAIVAGCAAVTPREGRVTTDSLAEADQDQPLLARGLSAQPPSYDSQLARLPAAPWDAGELASTDAPSELLRAWHVADNRRWCAPMAPELVHAAAARMMPLDGGWAVAFDAPGSPGVLPDGSTCEHCGIAAYGVAGTAATPEDWAELGPSHLAPSFRDGSLADFERSDEAGGAATASIVATGQHCVYQVWSFLGEDHLHDLVSGLRFVAVQDAPHHGPRVADSR